MSNQWEIVGRKKDKKTNQKVLKENSKNKTTAPITTTTTTTAATNVKLDEILNKTQMKNLYSSSSSNNNNNEKKLENTATTVKKNNNKKIQEKTQEIPKSKQPKSIESALVSINVEEFAGIFETSKNRFPDAPIVWLKDLTQFLNQKLHIDIQDCVFSTRPHNYPYSVIPYGIKNVMEKALKSAGKNNVYIFYDICLTSMATDLSKNLPCLGYKLFLQYIVATLNNDNELIITKLNKYIILRNSYQNRSNIGLSILWSIGQFGYKDFHIGMRIFEELMLPLIELKHYSRFIIKYLINIIIAINDNNSITTITTDDLLLILNVIYVNRKNFPNDLKQDLIDAYNNQLKSLLFTNNNNNNNNSNGSTIMIEYFLKQLSTLGNNKLYQDCLCDLIIEYCSNDDTALEYLSKIYRRNIYSCSVLFNYIVKNWTTVSTKLNLKIMASILEDTIQINNELNQKKKKEDGLLECIAAIKKLQHDLTEKTKTSNNKSSLKLFLLLITLIIAGFVYFDIKQNNNNWKDTRTRKLLIDSGLCGYCRLVIDKTKYGLQWFDQKLEHQFPGYHKIVVDLIEPYVELIKNLGIIFYNLTINVKEAFIEKYPAMVQSVESYMPGIMEISKNVWSSSIIYLNRSVDYLREKVFIGQLSPENMQKVVIEAINTTQNKATEYYYWLYEKVQTTIK